MKELSSLRTGMKNLPFDNPEYPKLRARENIIHQFEVLPKNEHVVVFYYYNKQVHMNPWSFDYIVDGFTNVIVLFHTPWCKECQDLLKEFVIEFYSYFNEQYEHAKTNRADVVIASIDAQQYVDYCV